MKNVVRWMPCLALMSLTIMIPAIAQAQKTGAAVPDSGNPSAALKARIGSVNALIRTLDTQIGVAAPMDAVEEDKALWNEQTAWLKSVRERYSAHLKELKGMEQKQLNGGDMVAKMAQMNMQFLALQEATQMESRRFQTLSNASKARHSIVMNAVGNAR